MYVCVSELVLVSDDGPDDELRADDADAKLGEKRNRVLTICCSVMIF